VGVKEGSEHRVSAFQEENAGDNSYTHFERCFGSSLEEAILQSNPARRLQEFQVSWQYQIWRSTSLVRGAFVWQLSRLGTFVFSFPRPGNVSYLPENGKMYHISFSQLFWQNASWDPENKKELQHLIQPHLQDIF
jgi:hypothetical protein